MSGKVPLIQHLQWNNAQANNVLIRTVSPFSLPASPSDS